MYTVIEGKEQDIDSWMELVSSVRWNFPGLESEKGMEDHRNTVLKFIEQRRAICVKEDKRIVGVLLFSYKYNMICCLAVDTNYRNRGIGSKLLEYALCRLDRTRIITVATFREEDEKGVAPRALYKKYGFIPGELTKEQGYPTQRFMLYPNCTVMDIYGDNYSNITRHCREASRGIIIKDGSVMLCHETRIDQWMIPGGGMEANETPLECCVREVAEETGLVVKPKKCFLIMNEYYEDWKYVSYYFECVVTGTTERKLTGREIQVGTTPKWVPYDSAKDIFSRHRDYAASNEERRGIYLREYHALLKYKKL